MSVLTYLWLAFCSRRSCGDEPRTYSAMLTPRVLVSETCDVSSTLLFPGKLPGLLAEDDAVHIMCSINHIQFQKFIQEPFLTVVFTNHLISQGSLSPKLIFWFIQCTALVAISNLVFFSLYFQLQQQSNKQCMSFSIQANKQQNLSTLQESESTTLHFTHWSLQAAVPAQ